MSKVRTEVLARMAFFAGLVRKRWHDLYTCGSLTCVVNVHQCVENGAKVKTLIGGGGNTNTIRISELAENKHS